MNKKNTIKIILIIFVIFLSLVLLFIFYPFALIPLGSISNNINVKIDEAEYKKNCKKKLIVSSLTNSSFELTKDIKLEMEQPLLDMTILPYTASFTFDSIETRACVIRTKQPFTINFKIKGKQFLSREFEFVTNTKDERLQSTEKEIKLDFNKFFTNDKFMSFQDFNSISFFSFFTENYKTYHQTDNLAVYNRIGIFTNRQNTQTEYRFSDITIIKPDLKVINLPLKNSYISRASDVLEANSENENRIKIKFEYSEWWQNNNLNNYCTKYSERCHKTNNVSDNSWIVIYLTKNITTDIWYFEDLTKI